MNEHFIHTDAGRIPISYVAHIIEETRCRYRVYYRGAAGKVRTACQQRVNSENQRTARNVVNVAYMRRANPKTGFYDYLPKHPTCVSNNRNICESGANLPRTSHPPSLTLYQGGNL